MQTHTDRRSPSQVKVGHRGGAEQGKVQALPRFFHAHLSLDPLRSCMKLRRHKRIGTTDTVSRNQSLKRLNARPGATPHTCVTYHAGYLSTIRSFGTENNAKGAIFQWIEKRPADQAGQACTILSSILWIHKNGLPIKLARFTNAEKMAIPGRNPCHPRLSLVQGQCLEQRSQLSAAVSPLVLSC